MKYLTVTWVSLFLLFSACSNYNYKNLPDEMTSSQRQPAEAGIIIGFTASLYDECVNRGFIADADLTAEEELNSALKIPGKVVIDNVVIDKEASKYFRMGWDYSKKVSIPESANEYNKDNCYLIEKRWNQSKDKYNIQ